MLDYIFMINETHSSVFCQAQKFLRGSKSGIQYVRKEKGLGTEKSYEFTKTLRKEWREAPCIY